MSYFDALIKEIRANILERWVNAKNVYSEDDALTSDRELLDQAFIRIYKMAERTLTPILLVDYNDMYFKIYEIDGKIVFVCHSYPGNNEIRELIND